MAGVEKVENGEYWRTVRLTSSGGTEVRGWIRVRHVPEKLSLEVSASVGLLPRLDAVLDAVKGLFGLYCDPGEVYGTLAPAMDKTLPGVCLPGTRVPGSFDAFETAVRAVLGQQITVAAAVTLAGRVAKAFGERADTGTGGLERFFPDTRAILAADASETSFETALGRLGVISRRARCILALAAALDGGLLVLSREADPGREIEKLLTLPGIGPWTAGYIAMRVLGHGDVFLSNDVGVKKALAGLFDKKAAAPAALEALAEAWRPWRSYATVNLWNSL
jgi:AraC family transcriptional regulator of adaptative response / DNA-3-methyladenine glycosylase II